MVCIELEFDASERSRRVAHTEVSSELGATTGSAKNESAGAGRAPMIEQRPPLIDQSRAMIVPSRAR